MPKQMPQFLRMYAKQLYGIVCLSAAAFSCYLGLCTVVYGRSLARDDEPYAWMQPAVLGGLILFLSLYATVAGITVLIPRPWRRPWWFDLHSLCFVGKPIPLLRLVCRYNRTDDIWTRDRCAVPQWVYCANGGTPKLPHFFTGRSSVQASDVGEICDYLLGCAYVSDQEQFGVGEYWQHPTQFEANRKGDCEDHALWAWRKLCDAGWNAEFVIGKRLSGETAGEKRHAWVVLHRTRGDFLLETVAKNRARICLPLPEVREKYVPYFSFDKQCRPWLYGGYLKHWQEQHERTYAEKTRKDDGAHEPL